MPKNKAEQKLYKQVGVKFDVEKWRRLKIMAAIQGRTVTVLLDDAIKDYLERHEGSKVRK